MGSKKDESKKDVSKGERENVAGFESAVGKQCQACSI
jgi:hypothetical protein